MLEGFEDKESIIVFNELDDGEQLQLVQQFRDDLKMDDISIMMNRETALALADEIYEMLGDGGG